TFFFVHLVFYTSFNTCILSVTQSNYWVYKLLPSPRAYLLIQRTRIIVAYVYLYAQRRHRKTPNPKFIEVTVAQCLLFSSKYIIISM
ncbi:MAG: hypothetical protein ACTSRR_13100, partial [Candidatus Heimdallarchaeaceae archaeon]